MLTITQVNYIRKMYFDKGLKVSEIEKRTGYARNTIDKYIEMDDFNQPKYTRTKERKSDLVRPFVRNILEEDKHKKRKKRHTAKRIYERALKEIPELCQIGERMMRNIVSQERKAIYEETECFLDLSHPGGEAQVDFGEVDIVEDGEIIKAHEFVMTFPKSNAGFCQITRSETMEAVCESLENIFKHIGKVLRKIWFDQMAAASLRKRDSKGDVQVNERFKRFALHHGFEIVFCNANSGNEKGSVENKVGYFRNNFFIPEVNIGDIEKYNQNLLLECDKDNERAHYKHKEKTIASIFSEELEKMPDYNTIPYDHTKLVKHHVYKNGHAKVDGNEYSVSPKMANQKVWVRYMANTLIFEDENHLEISHHTRCFHKKGMKFTHWIDFLTLISKRPRALKYTDFYSTLPKPWREYSASLEKEDLKEALHFLKHCLLEKDFDFASLVLSENLKQEVSSPDALWTTYYRLNEDPSPYLLKKDHPYPKMPAYHLALDDYDQLMRRVEQ